jgi:hypothetical protein
MPMRYLCIVAVLVALVAFGLPVDRAAAQSEQCFKETKQCISGRFATYWNENGGLAVFGFPVTTAAYEVNGDTGEMYLTQWFERNRFELHPDKPAPYDVLLGRLGNDSLKQQARDWRTLPKAGQTTAHYFEATGHAIAHPAFWSYWSSHGLEFDQQRGTSAAESLALFGLPLSEPQIETNSSGDTVLTQWFERARFEDHGAKGVLLGLLGNEVLHGNKPNFTPPPISNPPPANYACHPSYPSVCIPPPPPKLECKDIPYRNFPVIGVDPQQFDPDRNGIGCEEAE